MIVCVCNAIREKELKAVAREGHATAKQAYAQLGRRPKCGQCLSFARDLIAAERATA